MVYAKYVLWKMGLAPQWEPKIEDVLYAATRAHDVKKIVTPNRHWYYYVIPARYDIRYLYDLTRVFRANGVILRPHKSRNYNSIIFRVPNRHQQFMHDVARVNKEVDAFGNVLAEHNIEMSKADIAKLLLKTRHKDK